MTADTLTEKGSIVCLICNASVGVSTRNSCPIFQYNVTSSEQPVANILSVILGQEIRKELVHSEIICKKCFKLCNEVDELQERLTEIKMELNNYYQRTVRKVEGGQDDDMDSASPQVFMYPRAKPPKSTTGPPRRPGRPRKNPDILPGVPKYHPDENGTLEIDETIIGDEDDDEEDEDDRGIGLDDENDLDYIPNPSALSKKSPGDNLRKVHQALLAASGQTEGDVQIKLEVIDEGDEEHILDRDGFPKKKSLVKRKEPDVPNVIPRMIVSREGKTYTCLLCSAEEKVQGDAKAITIHMRDAHNIRLYICDMCGMEFLKRSELSAHFDQHVATEEGDFQCDVCNRVFTNLRLFRVHKRMHLPQPKNHICEICGKGFLSRNTLEEHMNIHTGSRPYKCNDCGKDFASKYSARAHEKTHTERPRPFKCHQCNKSFITEQNLVQHERTHVAVRSFSCQVCGKSFSSGRNLEVHCVVHTGYKPFICRMCGKAFARKAEIRDHERTHTGEKPYQCEFCGATFGQRSNLQSHKRATHYDDKRYQCVECGKAFKRRRLLDYHIKAAHTGERPYKCQICSATFIYPEHFKKHRRIHTGEKPYQCEVCGKAFNSRDNRNAHRFVHSDKKPYECLVCGVGFMRKPQLYNHMQAQGHVNDTIVVNQPRLTTDEDLLAQQAEEAQLAAVMNEHQTKWQTEEEQETETKVYISELKEHVIIQQGKNEDVGEEGHYTEEVGHLIIDGPVHFADGDTLELATTDGGATLAEGIEGAHHVVVPAGATLRAAQPGTEYTVEAGEGTTTMQTANGQVHLVQITLPESSEPHTAWFNIVEQ